MISNSGLPQNYKDFINSLFTGERKDRIEIINNDFDEVEFELELNGKKKTFYVVHKGRIQPDIDVSAELDYEENGNPKVESLVAQSEDLIRELIELRINI
jgi:hypothetical protein